MNRSLLDITDDLRALDQLLAEADGDISDPAVSEAVERWFAELDQDFDTKVDNYAALITEMKFRATSRKAEADRLAERARIDSGNAQWLADKLKAVMQQRGLKKLETRRYRLSVANNGGKLPLRLSTDNPKDLPAEYHRVTIDIDKAKVREALEAGVEVPHASFDERGTRLSIR